MGSFSKGFKNAFETAMVNKPSVFEPLKFHLIIIMTEDNILPAGPRSAIVSQGSRIRYPVWQYTFVSPSAFSRRAVVSYWRKYAHEVLVNRLGGLSLSRKSVVRLTDRPDMTLDVYRGRKTTIQQQKNILPLISLSYFNIILIVSKENSNQLLQLCTAVQPGPIRLLDPKQA